MAEGGTMGRVLFTKKQDLWNKQGEAPCPSTLQFNMPFPATCDSKQGEQPLPPSYEARFSGVPGLCAEISYTLRVRVTRLRCGVLRRCKTFVICLPFSVSPLLMKIRIALPYPCSTNRDLAHICPSLPTCTRSCLPSSPLQRSGIKKRQPSPPGIPISTQ